MGEACSLPTYGTPSAVAGDLMAGNQIPIHEDVVETVASGVGELTRLQSQGYAYIRP